MGNLVQKVRKAELDQITSSLKNGGEVSNIKHSFGEAGWDILSSKRVAFAEIVEILTEIAREVEKKFETSIPYPVPTSIEGGKLYDEAIKQTKLASSWISIDFDWDFYFETGVIQGKNKEIIRKNVEDQFNYAKFPKHLTNVREQMLKWATQDVEEAMERAEE